MINFLISETKLKQIYNFKDQNDTLLLFVDLLMHKQRSLIKREMRLIYCSFGQKPYLL